MESINDNNDKCRLEKIRQQIKSLPAAPGLYFIKDSKEAVLYIGKAKNLRSRVASYFQPSADLMASRGAKIVEMVAKACSVDYLQTKNEVDAILQEARLIKDVRPPYNTDLMDDKTFPYIEITTGDDFPGVYITRQPREKGSRLFGPFTATSDLRAILVMLQKIFRFRTCNLEIREKDDKKRFFRPCLLYSIKQCTGPCAAKIDKREYRQSITDLIKFLTSKRVAYLRTLKKQMDQAASDLDYERAAILRDRIKLIEKLDERGSVQEHVQPEAFASDPTQANELLGKLVGSDRPIRIIEGFDIAHLSGTDTVGSLVKFIDGRPFKAGYKRFKIKTVKGIDDYASLQEVISRRYKHVVQGEELWPDMILIDGGLGQLHAIEEVFNQFEGIKPYILSLAKREEIIYISGMDKPVKLPANSPVRKLLQYVRDEAHRFAQHYHHLLRNRTMLNGQ